MDFCVCLGTTLTLGCLVFLGVPEIPLIIRLLFGFMFVMGFVNLLKLLYRLSSLSRRPFVVEVAKKVGEHVTEFKVPLPAQELDVWLYIHGCTRDLSGKVVFKIDETRWDEVYLKDIKSRGKSGRGTFWRITYYDNSNALEQKYICVTTTIDKREPDNIYAYELDVIVGLQPQ